MFFKSKNKKRCQSSKKDKVNIEVKIKNAKLRKKPNVDILEKFQNEFRLAKIQKEPKYQKDSSQITRRMVENLHKMEAKNIKTI